MPDDTIETAAAAATATPSDAPMASRTPGRDVFGKLDSSIPEVRVPHQVKIDAEARAAELGLDVSAFLRENLYASLYGPDHIASLYEERARRVLGKAGREVAAPAQGGAVPSFLRTGTRK
jgi:hypothetical protein